MDQIGPVQFLSGIIAVVIADQEERSAARSTQSGNLYFGNALESSEARFQRFLNSGNGTRIHNRLRMRKALFLNLVDILQRRTSLKPSMHCSVAQQLGIWLQVWAHGTSVRGVAEESELSLETISRYVGAVLEALSSLSPQFIRLPDTSTSSSIPKEICSNPKFCPYFRDCIGAVDGSYIQGAADPDNPAAYRGRKSGTGMNVLFACTFDLRFCYVLPGWEASAHDSTVLTDAILHKGFAIPAGKYYLADAGYPSSNHCLVSYRGVRYHLNEQGLAKTRPENAKELYNLRHAMLRNVVERIIGVLKTRFRLLKTHNEYPVEKQVQGVYATAMIHNYLQSYNEAETLPEIGISTPFSHQQTPSNMVPDALNTPGALLRDSIANSMWTDYIQRTRKNKIPNHQNRSTTIS